MQCVTTKATDRSFASPRAAPPIAIFTAPLDLPRSNDSIFEVATFNELLSLFYPFQIFGR